MEEVSDFTVNDLMDRAIELALKGKGRVEPNPYVGAIIFSEKSKKIISEGYHEKFGGAHAEIVALRKLYNNGHFKDELSLIVNLEPCTIYGKTPPCVPEIINSSIQKIYVASLDPNPSVNGQGINLLQNAGKEVITGILESKNYFLNRRFFTFFKEKRPYVIVKWAQSINGVMGKKEEKLKITDIEDILVHRWRSEEMAIMTGGNTIRVDNPYFNIRKWYGRIPALIILTKNPPPPWDLNFLREVRKVFIFVEDKACASAWKSIKNVIPIMCNTSDIKSIFSYIWGEQIFSVFVEAGPSLISKLFEEDLWDEFRCIVKHRYLDGDVKAPSMPVAPVLHYNGGDFSIFIGFKNNYKCPSLLLL